MVELTILACVAIVVLAVLLWEARKERERLEDRLMAMSQPNALYTHKGLNDPEPGKVSYMDETREFAAGNGDIDLVGDD